MLVAVLLTSGLLFLGWLQARWLDEVARLEASRAAASLERSGRGLTSEFDRELTRVLVNFSPSWRVRGEEAGEFAASRLAAWKAEAPFPGLVARAEVIPLPADAAPRPSELPNVSLVADPAEPAIRLPVFAGRSAAAEGRELPTVVATLVVALDREAIRTSLLPTLAARHFDLAATEGVKLAVLSGREPPELLYRSDPQAAVPAIPDWSGELFQLLHQDDLRQLVLDPGDSTRVLRPLLRAPARTDPSWRLVAWHPDGGLAAAVERSRRRNLAVAFGTLVLLGAVIALLWRASARAGRLAARQLEFVAGVSHELRTPIAGIRALAENLADGLGAEPARSRRYGEAIRAEADRLGTMTEQLLTYGGILAQRQQPPQRQRLVDIVEAAIADCERIAGAGSVVLQVEGDPWVDADTESLGRAIANLISNALKHGDRDRVQVRVDHSDREARVRVEDRGPGIPRAQLEVIFEPFHRLEASTAIPGSGLGLTIARHVASWHHGRLEAHSEVGVGSTFVLTVPLAPSPDGEG